MRTRIRQMLAPAVLLAVGVWLLAGCVFIPTSDKPIRGSDAAREVGAEKSSRPIGLHRATRDEVIRLLGAPHYESADQTRIAYEWAVSDGVWVFPLCFTGYRQEGVRALLLTFDEAGVAADQRSPAGERQLHPPGGRGPARGAE